MESSSNHMFYLVAAYTLVWIMVSAYVLILSKRNQELKDQVKDFETRLRKQGVSIED
ncbi:CcmD family protein [Acanthopleuribacter pedis]|uniref:CcmD family protein n=1 Tax=Acanthopleuribacter pedis TaxID=442870 RepID=A0A8J7QJQ0_9BACT|nr:CcmD family protein [Acanthopleuribacter pedis]MBO1322136.1 CcmD family protein [Acanthopleuribacter pedis]